MTGLRGYCSVHIAGFHFHQAASVRSCRVLDSDQHSLPVHSEEALTSEQIKLSFPSFPILKKFKEFILWLVLVYSFSQATCLEQYYKSFPLWRAVRTSSPLEAHKVMEYTQAISAVFLVATVGVDYQNLYRFSPKHFLILTPLNL